MNKNYKHQSKLGHPIKKCLHGLRLTVLLCYEIIKLYTLMLKINIIVKLFQ